MHVRVKAAIACFTVLAPGIWAQSAFAQAPPESVEADISTRSVAITSNFDGTEILIFGTVENSKQSSAEAGTYDVIVTVEGVAQPATVRRKARVGGLWINTDGVRFSSFPAYSAIASTRPLEEVADPALLSQHEIGFEHVRMVPSGSIRWAPADAKEAAAYRDAAIRLKEKEGLFVKKIGGVIFRGRSLFRAAISLPPNVPVGPLETRLFLFREGKMLAQYKSQVMLERAGLERFLHDAAYNSPLLYGLATVLLAVAAGMGAAFALRRGSL